MKDYYHLQDWCFPRVDYARTVFAKINRRWVPVFSFIINRHTVKGYEGRPLREWPGFSDLLEEHKELKIDWTYSVLPYLQYR